MLKLSMVPPSKATGAQERPAPALLPYTCSSRGSGRIDRWGRGLAPGGTCFPGSLQRLKSPVTILSNLDLGASNSNCSGRKGVSKYRGPSGCIPSLIPRDVGGEGQWGAGMVLKGNLASSCRPSSDRTEADPGPDQSPCDSKR